LESDRNDTSTPAGVISLQRQQTKVTLVHVEYVPADSQMVMEQVAAEAQVPSSEQVHDTVVSEGTHGMSGCIQAGPHAHDVRWLPLPGAYLTMVASREGKHVRVRV
jgi:hypothetical protein